MLSAFIDNQRLRRLRRILERINALAETMADLTDEQLQAQTALFKARLAQGETVDDLLVEAFASIREAAKRVIGLYPYDVQVLGAIALHQGHVAEMKTGEGKTLTATMPLYLNALSGQGAILVTTNHYLADRDAQEMGKIYAFMGLSVGNMAKEHTKTLSPAMKRALYACDIIYTTHSALGFDYLIDNLASHKTHKYMRPFHYVIIDEIDAVLLDQAQTPLVISGAPKVQSNLYQMCQDFILTLDSCDYACDDEKRHVWLTESGMQAAEAFFEEEELYVRQNVTLVHHILLALKAHTLYDKDKDYVIDEGSVKLLDRQDGRIIEGVKLQSGQHQALEAKEQVKLTIDHRAMASITYQNLFKLFKRLSGMTGTGKVAQGEFMETYQLEVVVIPTHHPLRRHDYPDKVYASLPDKLYASMEMVKAIHQTGQPVLIATANVDVSAIYSKLLLMAGIPHNVLNAYNVAKEAAIIKEAGQRGAVTVATPIAGRGTDIVLGPGVSELGGLAIIGTEKMMNARIDLQLRGRSGRQGDPGMSQFFISLEDDVVVKHGAKWVIKHYHTLSQSRQAGLGQLHSKRIVKAIRQAQDVSEEVSKQARALALAFDETVKIQRKLLYKERDILIAQTQLNLEPIYEEVLERFVNDTEQELTRQCLERYILDRLSYHFTPSTLRQLDVQDKPAIKAFLMDIIHSELTQKETVLHSQENITNFYRTCVLKAMDENWIIQVDYLQQLRAMMSHRIHAQKNPLNEYKKEAYTAFKHMRQCIKDDVVRYTMLSKLSMTDESISIQFM